MSDKPATPKTNGKKPTLWITGRIKSTNQIGLSKDNFPIIQNVIIAPAADAYSYPDRYCVMTRSKIGNEGDDITIEAQVHCRSYEATDKKTNTKITRFTHDLWAVQ